MGIKLLVMKGWIKYGEQQSGDALKLIERINQHLNLPSSNGLSKTWSDGITAFCTLDSNSGATIFWGSVVKVDTDQMGDCLTQQEIESIIQIPEGCKICGQ